MLDTTRDFVEYLGKKERFLTSKQIDVIAAGEDDLLAYYLQKLNKDNEHDFVIPSKINALVLDEGFWLDFCRSEERHSQVQANHVSYSWDALIESFIQHTVGGTQYYHRLHR
jgi:hypothetical protein